MTAPAPATIATIPVSDIRTPDGSRTADETLLASIRLHGVLQPIGVQREGEGWRIVFGARRLAACREAGLASVPCVVFPSDLPPGEMLAKTLTENLERLNMSPLQEGALFGEMLEMGMTLVEVAARVARPTSYVSSRVKIARLPPQAIALLDGLDWQPSAVALLCRLPIPQLVEVLERNPEAASSVDEAKTAIARASLPLSAAAFDQSDCQTCGKREKPDLCLDVACYADRANDHANQAIAALREGKARNAPCVVGEDDFTFATAEDKTIYKRHAAAVLRDQRVAAPGETGTPAILLGPGGAARLVQLVPAPRKKDGRSVPREERERRKEEVAASSALERRLWKAVVGDIDLDPDISDFVALASAIADADAPTPEDAFRVLLRLLYPNLRARLRNPETRADCIRRLEKIF